MDSRPSFETRAVRASSEMRISAAERKFAVPAAMPSSQSQIAVIGAGPAGLMAAEVLAQGGAGVTVYDAMPSAGRKFLMAGRGGLNLTHSEALPDFMKRYGEAPPQLATAIAAFPPERFARMEQRAGAADLCRLQRPGVSKSVQGFAIAARVAAAAGLRGRAICDAASLDRLGRERPAVVSNARRRTGCRCQRHGARARRRKLAAARLRWGWVETLAAKGVAISTLQPANCGFTVAWSGFFRDRFEGQPLKGVALSFGAHTVRGEAIITRTGIEGGAIYALSARFARSHRQFRAGDPARRLAARSRDWTIGRAAVGAEGQTIALELAAQSGASLAGRHRPVAGGARSLQARRYPRCHRQALPD